MKLINYILMAIMGLMTISGALAALPGTVDVDFTRNNTRIEELTRVENNELIIDPVDEQVVPIRPRAGEKAGIRIIHGRGYHVLEADPYIGMRMKPSLPNATPYTLSFRVFRSNTYTYPLRDVPVTFCVNGTIPTNSRIKRVSSSPWCQGDFERIYQFPRLGFDRTLTMTMDSIPNTWQVWFGGDTLVGISPQGFGDGLPVCTGISAKISVNETSILVGQKFTHKIRADWLGSSSAGCSLNSLEAQNKNDLNQWKVITSTNVSNSNLLCLTGSTCLQNPASFGVWYSKEVKCKWAGNRTLRTRAFGTVGGNPSNPASVQKNIECRNVPTPPDDEEELPSFAALPEMPRNYLGAVFLPFAFLLTLLGHLGLQQKKRTEARKQGKD